MARAIIMKAIDNVCTVVEAIEPPTAVTAEIDGKTITVLATERIPFGHKIALKSIPKGQPIIKYGETIGLATKDIQPGQHVHVHNLESCRGRGDKLTK
ncbi:UxaA family hydrolase [Sporolituus thermophilus]|uniref:Altronate dehydratase small subunit n=1 Tax=Sporolituus thermophilus DSM 23256 TaxID=1123285 RepID=A0A1G7KH46_9FIRM|nr:UxaA family hydrolase [Sporolituus thermophilus]SDF36563.1 altronate dehydratase small subunit [Sporolituus thermophilus DSM 23256]